MLKTNKDFLDDRISMLVYAPSGHGKTRLIPTLPGKKLVVNAENGLLSISRIKEEIDVYDLTVDRNNKRLDNKQRFRKLIYFLEKVLPELDEKKYDWIIFDSITEISQNLVEFLKSKYPDKKDSMNLWGENNEYMTELIKQLRDLRPFNILFLALDAVDKDENSRRYVGIDMYGKISRRIHALLDEIFYLEKFEDDKGQEFSKLITSNYKNILCKDRSGALDKFMDPDLNQVVNRIKGVK